jgi:putative Mg2+ transporter-C (MgtC) family protein
VSHQELDLLGRVLVGAFVGYAIGFEREIRGANAGDRTFSLIGLGSAAVTAVTVGSAPHALGGILTGVGFVGAGLVLQQQGSVVGITTAATIFTVASIGVVAGTGHLVVAGFVGALVIVILETRHLPILRFLDGRRYRTMIADDADMPHSRSS